jgi:2-polyprenyl-6-methoxyphenol hydroxylase-like FAD-dependent oxidoreductase
VKTDLHCDVVIVGGGVAGGGLANQLAPSGLKVIVVELNLAIPPINRGDQLSPPSVMALDKVGALQSLWDRGAVKIHHWQAVGQEGRGAADAGRDLPLVYRRL